MQQTFEFVKYVSLGWYFRRYPTKGRSIPVMMMDESVQGYFIPSGGLIKDEGFESQQAKNFDLGLRAFHSGILLERERLRTPNSEGSVPLADEYRFLRKFYKKSWLYWALFIRICSLKNPLREFAALRKSRNVKRFSLHKELVNQQEVFDYESPLVSSPPKVTVIIPTLNRYPYLRDAIKDLELQTIPVHELIVIDQSDAPDEAFYKDFKINLKLIVQKVRGQWVARNEAIRQSTGEWLLFFDDDSRVNPDWVAQHLKAVDYFKADICAGVSLSKVGDKIPQNYSFYRWADQFDSGNALVHRRVFEDIGMFDRQYDRMRMGDGEFGMRAYLNGYKSISSPEAFRVHLKVDSGGLRQVGSWDAFRTKKLLAPLPIPSVSFFYLTYFDLSSLKLLFFQNIFTSEIPYRFKGRKGWAALFLFIAFLKLPLSIFRFIISVQRADKMLKEGPIIDKI